MLNNFAIDISKNTFSISEIFDKNCIVQSLECIIMTKKYERVFQTSFGSFLSEELFHTINEDNAEEILDRLISLIKKWEKRIIILDDKCTMNIDKNNKTLYLNIIYILNGNIEQFYKKIIF